MIIYIGFELKFIFEKRTQQITTYYRKILSLRLHLIFFWETGARPQFLETSQVHNHGYMFKSKIYSSK